MPTWEGKWIGGRFYRNDLGEKVFVIERRVHPHRYSIKLKTHHEDLAAAEYTRFLQDPVGFARPTPPPPAAPGAVDVSTDRITRYMESIRHSVIDHQKARRSYLVAWSQKGLDLRTVDRPTLRAALASFDGGHAGRTEALNAFARFLVKEGELVTWNPLKNTHDTDPELARAERVAYSLEELRAAYEKITSQTIKDLFLVRAATGMHQTEIDQLEGAKVSTGPLPDKGVGIRKLGGKHEIQGVLQVMHKSQRRHRQSVTGSVLRAVLRLRDGVPSRISVWKALRSIGIVPSNLRHTFDTLSGEVGERVTYKAAGVDRALIAQVMGHRAGSTMGPDRYEKIQIPVMIRLPLEDWNVL